MFLFVFVRLVFFPVASHSFRIGFFFSFLCALSFSHIIYILIFFLVFFPLFFSPSALYWQKMHLSVHISIFFFRSCCSLYLSFVLPYFLSRIWFYYFFSKCFMCLPCTKQVCAVGSMNNAMLCHWHQAPQVLATITLYALYAHIQLLPLLLLRCVSIIICCYRCVFLRSLNKNDSFFSRKKKQRQQSKNIFPVRHWELKQKES